MACVTGAASGARPKDETLSADRFKAFADAVVAIAMTLLILPLMESVGETAGSDTSTVDFLVEHGRQIGSFVLSFALISNFWLIHHRLYEGVERITSGLLRLNIAWMLTIVWLPVPTAMVGQATPDRLQAILYVGTLLLTCALTVCMRLTLLRRPELVPDGVPLLARGLSVDFAMIVCFSVALVGALLWPGPGYMAFFMCVLIGPVQRIIHPLVARRLGVTLPQDPSTRDE